jgi:hypothetical protein
MPIPIPSPWRGGGLNWLVQRFRKFTSMPVGRPYPTRVVLRKRSRQRRELAEAAPGAATPARP